MDLVTEFFVRILPGLIIAFFAARWAASKFYAEKSWERKERAYEEIIHALYDLIRYFRIHKEDYGQGTGLAKDKEHELFEKYLSASSSLGKATDIGSFYISGEASEVLRKLREREQLNYHEEPKFEFFEKEYQGHAEALESFVSIAKKNLRIK